MIEINRFSNTDIINQEPLESEEILFKSFKELPITIQERFKEIFYSPENKKDFYQVFVSLGCIYIGTLAGISAVIGNQSQLAKEIFELEN